MPDKPLPRYWARFIKQYNRRETHWYVSKIKSYDMDSLRQLQQGLRLLDKWFVRYESLGRKDRLKLLAFSHPTQRGKKSDKDLSTVLKWTPPTELFFAWLLDREGAISEANRPAGIRERYEAILRMIDEDAPYRVLRARYGEKLLNDLAANARNFLSMYKKLGLAWVESEQTVSLTSTGERYIAAETDEELRAIFERQVVKWQLYNPTLPRRYRALRLFPLVFLLRVLLKLKPAHLSKAEYALFVTKAETMAQVDGVVANIEAWRKLNPAERAKIISALEHPPPSRRRALFVELMDSANKEIEFLALTSPLTRITVDGAMGIGLSNRKRAQQFVKLRGEAPVFIEFESELDWFSYYGDWEQGPTVADAVEYYAQIGEIEKAKAVARLPEATAIEKSRVRRAVQERHIEDYFIDNLELIERGLRLYRRGSVSGRQYKTPINRVDTLCVDRHDRLVVIEYKKGKSADETVGQTLRYMGWVRVNLAGGKRVRGIIVAEKIDDKTKYAIQGMQWARGEEPVTLFEHSVKLSPIEL